MQKLVGYAVRLLKDQSGSTAIEYGLIAALMALVAIAGMTLFGNSLSGVFNYVSNHVENASTG